MWKYSVNNGLRQECDAVNLVRKVDPKSYGLAMRGSQKDKWVVAIKEELQALKENSVWTVKVSSTGSHVLHMKWVFKTKADADEKIERYKARPVACRSEQLFRIDWTFIFRRFEAQYR